MNYQYKALNPEGGIVSGTIEVQSYRCAVRTLKTQGLNVVEISEKSEIKKLNLNRLKRSNSQDILLYMSQLSVLLESGVSIEESLASLSESAGQSYVSYEFSNILNSLRKGESFSQAIKLSDIQLPSYYYSLIEAGELTGKLSQSIKDGVIQWEYELRTTNDLRNALIYPMILIISGIGAIMLIFAWVVPKFTSMLKKTNAEIPLIARIVLTTGSFVNENIILIGLCVLILIILFFYIYSSQGMKQYARDFFSRFPFLGNLMIEYEIGNWSGILATLLENRVSLLISLELALRSVKLSAFQAHLFHAAQSVRHGKSLSESLKNFNGITATGYNLIKVGEKSGELPKMLRSLSVLYTDMNKNRTKRFLLLVEPIAILFIGSVIGFIMAGILLAITSVNNIQF